jgi:Trypsin-like peptidase domain
MRCGPLLIVLALLIGAVAAQAQDSPGIIPMPKETATQPAKKHVRPKAAAAKPVAAKPAKPKAAEAKAVAPKPAVEKPAAAKIVAKPAETKTVPADDVFAGIPPAERRKIQAALLWAGDYTGAAGGDDPMLTAIKNFQKRHKAKVTGVLTPSERADLIAAAKAHEDEFGWNVVVDPATGIRIGLPTKLVPHARDAAHGTRWSSKHGEVKVETFRIKEAGLTLAALFEREKKEPHTRKIEASALHDDGFTISGMQGLKMFSVRAKQRDGEIRGFTILYDQMMETIVAPVTAAMVAAFSPFPERSAPFAVLAKSVEYGNGLVVSAQGHIVTDLKLTQGCQVIVAAGLGDADRVGEDQDDGLALLRVYGARKLAPVALTHDAPKAGELTLIGIPDPKEQNGRRKLTEIKARLAGGSAIEPRQPVPMAGFSGAAALDAQGRLLGMMEMGHAVLASVEATAPPVRLIGAETIRDFLSRHHVQTAQAQTADAKASVVQIICVRK